MNSKSSARILTTYVFYISWISFALGQLVYFGGDFFATLMEFIKGFSLSGFYDLLLFSLIVIVSVLALLLTWLCSRNPRKYLKIIFFLSFVALAWSILVLFVSVLFYVKPLFSSPTSVTGFIVSGAGFILGILIVWSTAIKLRDEKNKNISV